MTTYMQTYISINKKLFSYPCIIHFIPCSIRCFHITIIMPRVARISRMHQNCIQLIPNRMTLKTTYFHTSTLIIIIFKTISMHFLIQIKSTEWMCCCRLYFSVFLREYCSTITWSFRQSFKHFKKHDRVKKLHS